MVALPLLVALFVTVLPAPTLTVTLLADINIAFPAEPPVLTEPPSRLIVVPSPVTFMAPPAPVLFIIPPVAVKVPLPARVRREVPVGEVPWMVAVDSTVAPVPIIIVVCVEAVPMRVTVAPSAIV